MMTWGESQRRVHAVQFERDRVPLFVESPMASSQEFIEKHGIRVN
jgi:hypothetical protein